MTACSLCAAEIADGLVCSRCGRDASAEIPAWEVEARALAPVRRFEAINVVKMNQYRLSLVEAMAIVDRWRQEQAATDPT